MIDISEYGIHRVAKEDYGKLPQAAWKLNNDSSIYKNEILVEVECLNVDSASFHQLLEEVNYDEEKLKQRIYDIINERGKMHNPVTSSGGILVGIVREIGEAFEKKVKVGDRIISLVSLSLTPLKIEEIIEIKMTKEQLIVRGHAILFSSSNFYVVEDNTPIEELLSILDVAGAPAQTLRLAQKNQIVFIAGAAGKSGLLSMVMARKKIGEHGLVVALVYTKEEYELLKSLRIANYIIIGDATKPVTILEKYKSLNIPLSDLTLNCTNVSNTEMSTIIVTKNRGVVYFFNMATSFSAAALGAEGIGKDVDLMIGNGFMENHVEIALEAGKELKKLFESRGIVDGVFASTKNK